MIQNKDVLNPITVSHAEPVLAVKNITETVDHWHHVLAFPDKWTWGEPPNHGGVSWHGAGFIQFSLNPKLAALSHGHAVWIRVKNLEALYALHQEKKANIVSAMEDKPYGFAEYTVQDINGYFISFAGPLTEKTRKTQSTPETVRIVLRSPTASEYRSLMTSVGWLNEDSTDKVELLIQHAVFAVVAEDTKSHQTIGCAFVFGDNAAFYYVKDVIVLPPWQHMGIGTLLMKAVDDWIKSHAPDYATVGLFTGEHLTAFYRRFGFTEACGMYKQIMRKQ